MEDTPGKTPVKPRLGKFVDVYSPEHLNLTPRNVCIFFFLLKSDIDIISEVFVFTAFYLPLLTYFTVAEA